MEFLGIFIKRIVYELIDNSKELDFVLKEMAKKEDERLPRVVKEPIVEEPFVGYLREKDDVDLEIRSDEPAIVKIQKKALAGG